MKNKIFVFYKGLEIGTLSNEEDGVFYTSNLENERELIKKFGSLGSYDEMIGSDHAKLDGNSFFDDFSETLKKRINHPDMDFPVLKKDLSTFDTLKKFSRYNQSDQIFNFQSERMNEHDCQW